VIRATFDTNVFVKYVINPKGPSGALLVHVGGNWWTVGWTSKLVSRVVSQTSLGVQVSTDFCRDVLELWHERRFELVISNELLEEVDQVLRRKKLRALHRRSDQEIDILMKNLKTAIRVVPVSDVDVPALAGRDPDDLVVVATGKAGRVDYIVTRDEDLHSLGEVEGMKVVYPEEFLAIIRATQTDDS